MTKAKREERAWGNDTPPSSSSLIRPVVSGGEKRGGGKWSSTLENWQINVAGAACARRTIRRDREKD